MASTVTVGGATWGYCAIGIDGIASTPARMITSEQTVARMGRLMKVSTNMVRQAVSSVDCSKKGERRERPFNSSTTFPLLPLLSLLPLCQVGLTGAPSAIF